MSVPYSPLSFSQRLVLEWPPPLVPQQRRVRRPDRQRAVVLQPVLVVPLRQVLRNQERPALRPQQSRMRVVQQLGEVRPIQRPA